MATSDACLSAEELPPRKRLRTKATVHYTITAKLISGAKLASVQLNSAATIADLQRSLLQRATGPEVHALQLLYRGSLLKSNQSLAESGLQDC